GNFNQDGNETNNSLTFSITQPPPTLSISANDSAQQEGGSGDTTIFLFTVTRTGDTSSSSSAEYTVAGSGSNPVDSEDFIDTSFQSDVVNFAAGEDTQIISIEIAGDSILEQDETFSVTLTSPTNASISPSNASAIATISNDDSPPQTSILFEETFEDSATWGRNWGLDPLTGWQRSSRRATEGTSSGELNGNVNNGSMTSLAIDLSGNYSSATLNFDWRIQRNLDNNESVSVDISNDNGESWTQNERTLRGNIDTENLWTQESIDLTSFIGSSEVRIRFRGTMNGQNERVNVDAIRVTAENIINGAAPILSISADASAQPEGAPGDTTTFLFTVTRTGDTSRSSSAEYTVTGSGSNPTDLQDFIGNSFPSGVVNFAAGEDTQIISIEIAGDSILEQDETFSVTLTSPTNASISPSNASAIATISNDDSPPQTSILFEETFEDSATWGRNWGLDPLTGWQRSSRRATEGTWSGEVNGNVNNGSMTSLAIDLSGNYSSATLNFDWRIQRNLDNNESVSVDISNDNGESWTQNERTLRGNIDTENLWTQESIDLTSFIGSSEVRIRFRGTMNRGNERANVDNINISATSGNINGQLRSENFEDSQNTIDDLLEVVKPLPDPLS
uniref:Calx-beta domain-containing protein n=1 Tax=Synechococcus sp. MU1655 TaxID=2508355 RepID=UPI002026677E